MKRFFFSRPLLLAAATGMLSASSFAASLKMGDPAPAIKTGDWVQGEAVKEFDKDHVYVVEFWATWCGPCKATIPHLDELHEKYKDKGVVFIGQNVWERAAEKVPGFVKDMGEQMSYRVAMDYLGDDKEKDSKGYMAENWMKAAGQNGIPCAFVVGKDGKIAWIGHPGGMKEEMLDQVIAGSWDVAKAKELADKEEAEQGKMQEIAQRMGKAAQNEEWKEALAAADELEAAKPELAANLAFNRMRFQCGLGDEKAALASLDKLKTGQLGKNAAAMSQAGSMLLTGLKGASKETAAMALAMVEKGLAELKDDERSKAMKPMMLHAKARGQFLTDDAKGATATQKEAVEACEQPAIKSQLETHLKSYEEGKLPEQGSLKMPRR